MNKKKAQNRFVFACLAPAVILVFIFMVIPTIDVFKTAFFKKSNFVSDATFAGFFNFKVLFNDMRFIEAMQNTILCVVLITIITLVLAVLFATLLTREEFVGKNFFRVIFYIPNILSIVVIAGIFSAIYQPTNGILNTFFGMIGLSSYNNNGWEIRLLLTILLLVPLYGRPLVIIWLCICRVCRVFQKTYMRLQVLRGLVKSDSSL